MIFGMENMKDRLCPILLFTIRAFGFLQTNPFCWLAFFIIGGKYLLRPRLVHSNLPAFASFENLESAGAGSFCCYYKIILYVSRLQYHLGCPSVRMVGVESWNVHEAEAGYPDSILLNGRLYVQLFPLKGKKANRA